MSKTSEYSNLAVQIILNVYIPVSVDFSAFVHLLFCGFCSEEFTLPLGAWDRLHPLIMALPWPSI